MRLIRASLRLLLIGICLSSLSLMQLSGRGLASLQRHLRWLARICGLRIVMRGDLPSGRFLLLANHISYLDIIALGSLLPMGFMAKSEIRNWPLLGKIIARVGTIFVERDSVRGRFVALNHLKSGLEQKSYCVFPEGTTTAQIAPTAEHWFRGNISIMQRPGVPIYLAALHYADQASIAWIDDDALLPHLWKLLQRPRVDLHVHFDRLSNSSGSLPQLSLHARQRLACLATASRHLVAMEGHTKSKKRRPSLFIGRLTF